MNTLQRSPKHFPITVEQLRFWLAWKLEPHSSKYNLPLLYRLQGNLNINALKEAIFLYTNEFHTACRHYFLEDNLTVRQYILDSVDCELELFTIKEPLSSIIEPFCNHHFDLTKPPLIKFGLIEIDSNNFIFMVNPHHIIADAYTGYYLIEKLSVIYNAVIQDNIKSLSFSNITYQDYSKQKFNHKNSQNTHDYWISRLKDKNLRTDIPFEHRHYAEHSDLVPGKLTKKMGNSVYFHLEDLATTELQKLAKSQGTTLFILLSSLFAITLSRLTHQKEITVVYPVNTRKNEFHRVAGCFVNTIPMLIELADNDTFVSLIANLTKQRKQDKHHELCSFIEVLQHLHQIGVKNLANIFNVSIVEAFLNRVPFGFQDIHTECLIAEKSETIYDLSLQYQLGNHLEFKLDYDSAILTQDNAQKMADTFLLVVDACLQNCEQNLFSFPILTNHDQHLLQQWSSGQHRLISDHVTLMSLFNETFTKFGKKTALQSESREFREFREFRSMTYEALDKESTRLANIIKHKTQHPIIALYLDKSVEAIIGILAILKAGRSFLPLDIDEPSFRVQKKLTETNIDLLLSVQKHEKSLASFNFIQCYFLDVHFEPDSSNSHFSSIPEIHQDNNLNSNQNNNQLKNQSNNQNLVSILYTSGSQGSPKPVMLNNMNFINVILDLKHQYQLSDKDRILSLSSLSFDVFSIELFLAFCTGASFLFTNNSTVKNPKALVEFIQKSKPTLIHATPTLWMMLLPLLKMIVCDFTIISTGEPLTPTLAKELLKLTPKVWNAYGPTETSIATLYRLKPDGIPYIGKPIANTKVTILDQAKNLVPIGVVGELYISGLSVAQGYWGDASLTQQKFHGGIYQTGDWVRFNSDGYVEYLGRQDSQIKIRGYRVDLSEIEMQLLQCKGITFAHCALKQDNLVAYLCYQPPRFLTRFLKIQSPPSKKELFEYVKQKLPSYMLPSAFVLLDSPPKTISGKVDQQNLPPPSPKDYLQSEFQKPLDVIELRLLSLWQEILTLAEISIVDDFFQIGGNSFLAVFLVTKINDSFQMNYSVPWVLQNSTILSQAKALRKEQHSHVPYCSYIPFNPKGSEPSLFLIHPGFAGAESYSELAKLLHKNLPFYAIDSHNLNSGNPHIDNMEELAYFYVKLIQEIAPKGPVTLGGWSFGGLIAFEIAQQLVANNIEVRNLFLIDTHIFNPSYLEHIEEILSFDIMLDFLTKDRRAHLTSLPQTYLDRIENSFRTDIKIMKKYQIKPYAHPAVLIKSTKKWGLFLPNKDNGWKKYIKQLKIYPVHSTHMNLIEGKDVHEVARIIQSE